MSSSARRPRAGLFLLLVGFLAVAGCDREAEDPPSSPTSTSLPVSEETVGVPAGTVPLPSASETIRISLRDDAATAVAASPPGSTFVFESGIHRGAMIEPRDGDRFVGEEGSILSGARQVTTFEESGNLWVASNQTEQGETRGVCEAGYEGCVFPEQLFVDNQPLLQVTDVGDVGPDSWYFDYEADRIYFAVDPRNRLVEVSDVRFAFFGSAENVTIQNLIVEKYANPAQLGAIHGVADPGPLSSGWMIEGNIIRYNHGSGIRLGRRMTVRGNVIHHNGHIGINGTGRDIIVESNEIAYNQTGGFLAFGWVGGGAKFIDTEGLRVIDNFVHDNNGHGLHTDHNNIDTLYRGNVIEHNAGTGINHEISYTATILENRVTGNGFGRSRGVLGAGIMINTSSDVEVIGNEVQANADGIVGQHADRGEGDHGRWELRALRIDSNLVELTQGSHGVTAGLDEELVFSQWGNRFTGNTYELHPGAHFVWNDRQLDFSAWQAAGQDVEGRLVENIDD